MVETAMAAAAGIIFAGLTVWTLRVVIRDDPGPRPTRSDYDSRRPQ